MIELARMKLARSDFSLLARSLRDGVSNDIEEPDILINEMEQRLRKNLKLLLKSPMPLSRKVLCTLIAYNYKVMNKCLHTVKR